MKKLINSLTLPLLGLIALTLTPTLNAAPSIGEAAPDFTLIDTNGDEVALSEMRGKTVVLEWTNHECPFVVKHYGSGNMQGLQTEAATDEIVWVTVISSAKGKQGYVDAAQANQLTNDRNAAPKHILLDPTGDLGRLYDARTTPHMFVIGAEGELAYMGGIDDKPTADKADIEGANNYVRAALSEVKAGSPVSIPTSRPYGCSVKYDT